MKPDRYHDPTAQQAELTYPSLTPLNALVGGWNLEISVPSDPAAVIAGLAAFEWLAGEFFLVEHWDVAQFSYPAGIAVIGWDAANENYSRTTYDSRGVTRVYEMSLNNGLWLIWRESPGFSQRFSGTFSADGNTIKGHWERSIDGLNWEADYDVTYTKVNGDEDVRVLFAEKEEEISLLDDPTGV